MVAGINDVSISQCVDWLPGLWCGEWVYTEKRGRNLNVHVHLGVCVKGLMNRVCELGWDSSHNKNKFTPENH